ncbi:MAG: YigZ family protein [Microlunatus sp.]
MDSYLVPARDATAEIEVKRSRFLCRVARVESEEDARAVIAEERRAYGTAGHHCSAFILGPDAGILRSNDDGEPSGTAGPPILDALQGAQLSDAVAVVTRWFGGTLLGTGGLVQAYGDATRAALAVAGARCRELRQRLETTVDFAIAGRLEDQLRRVAAIEVDYDTGLPRLRVAVGRADLDEVTTMILTSSNGCATITELTPIWVDAT